MKLLLEQLEHIFYTLALLMGFLFARKFQSFQHNYQDRHFVQLTLQRTSDTTHLQYRHRMRHHLTGLPLRKLIALLCQPCRR